MLLDLNNPAQKVRNLNTQFNLGYMPLMDTSAKERALQDTPLPTGRPRTVLSISHHTYRTDRKKEHDEPRGVKGSNAAHKETLKFPK